MINPAIQKSIEAQEAAKKCNLSKIKMVKIIKQVNKSFPHHSADMIADEVIEAKELLSLHNNSLDDCSSLEIADLVIDIIEGA